MKIPDIAKSVLGGLVFGVVGMTPPLTMFSGSDQLKAVLGGAGSLGLGLLVAVPGALVSAPFSMVLMAAFLTQVGALQTAPILIAVVTAFLTIESVKYVLASRRHPRSAEGEAGTPAGP
ncbi:MAG: hypothetical protein ACXVEQ_00330 [Nocardioidaceae bacterium]